MEQLQQPPPPLPLPRGDIGAYVPGAPPAAAAAGSSSCDPVLDGFACLVREGRARRQKTTLLSDLPPSIAGGGCRTPEEAEDAWNRNDVLLGRYWSPGDGFERGPRHHQHQHQHALTYGEVTPLGVRQLADAMGIAPRCDREDDDEAFAAKKAVFCDLGSGVGRLVAQIVLDQPDAIARATGIELSFERHALGVAAVEALFFAEEEEQQEQEQEQQDAPRSEWTWGSYDEDNDGTGDAFPAMISPLLRDDDDSSSSSSGAGKVRLIHGNVLDAELDPDTTHVFVSSLCFPDAVLDAVQARLRTLPDLRVVAALNRLDKMNRIPPRGDGDNDSDGDGDNDNEARKDSSNPSLYWDETSVPIQTSWGDCLARIYHRVVVVAATPADDRR